PRYQKYLKHVPMGGVGAAIVASALLPRELLVLCALPGAILAFRRQRLFAWLPVSAVGFPAWARADGWAFQRDGVLETLRWHASDLGQQAKRLTTRLRPGPSSARLRLKAWLARTALAGRCGKGLLRLGWAQNCRWCKLCCFTTAGHVDANVDKHWYCEDCWNTFDRHRQCAKCKRWQPPTPGQSHSKTEGDYLCHRCSQAPDSQRGVKRQYLQYTERPLARFAKSRRVSAPGSSTDSQGETEPPMEPTAESALPRPLANPACVAGDAVAEASPRMTRVKCQVWRTVERATGVSFSSASAVMPQLDSLRSAKLQSLLRREVRRRVPRETIRRATTLEQLIAEVQATPMEQDHTQTDASAAAHTQPEYAMWGCMWRSKCEWLVRRDTASVSEPAFRLAVARLIQRHEVLRTELADPFSLWHTTQQALTAFELWRRHGTKLLGASPLCPKRRPLTWLPRGLGRCASRAVDPVVSWGFRQAWPRVRAAPPASDTRASRHKGSNKSNNQFNGSNDTSSSSSSKGGSSSNSGNGSVNGSGSSSGSGTSNGNSEASDVPPQLPVLVLPRAASEKEAEQAVWAQA
ncbi:unnamed protein product, partial [Polarella glacialis]